MSNLISFERFSASAESLSMSNQGTDCFLDLLLYAAEKMEKTPSQEALTVFLQERKEINAIAPGNAGFDVEEMPWNPVSLSEDSLFLLDVIEKAKSCSLPYEIEKGIVFPWLDQFAKMVEKLPSFDPVS